MADDPNYECYLLGATREREAIVEWLRKAEIQHLGAEFEGADKLAAAIERRDHLKAA